MDSAGEIVEPPAVDVAEDEVLGGVDDDASDAQELHELRPRVVMFTIVSLVDVVPLLLDLLVVAARVAKHGQQEVGPPDQLDQGDEHEQHHIAAKHLRSIGKTMHYIFIQIFCTNLGETSIGQPDHICLVAERAERYVSLAQSLLVVLQVAG